MANVEENTKEIEISLPDAAMLKKERDSVLESKVGSSKANRQPKYLYHGMGLVGFVAIIAIILAVSLTHKQKTYNGSKEVLQSLSNADGMRLTVIARGPLVSQVAFIPEETFNISNEVATEMNATMHNLWSNSTTSGEAFNITAEREKMITLTNRVGASSNQSKFNYSFPAEDDSEQMFTIIAIPMKDISSEELMKFKMRITTEHTDGSLYNITLVNTKGSYLRQNLTSGDTIVESCITQDLVPPVDEIATSILNANVLEVDEEIGLELVGCDNAGKIVHATWSGHQYLYCIEHEKITHIAGNHLTVNIEYLDEFTSKQYSESITVPDRITSLSETMICPELDLTDAGDYFDNLMSNVSNDSRRLLDIPKVEEEHWWLNHNLKHPSVRRLSTSIDNYFPPGNDGQRLINLGKLLNCYYFCVFAPPLQGSGGLIGAAYIPNSPPKSFNSVRKLATTQHSITLPRDCIFFHGAGFYFWTYGGFRASHFHAWGNIHNDRPCYCKYMKFIVMDTYNYAWYDTWLQMQLWADFGRDLFQSGVYPLDIKNVIIFTHFTSALTVGAAIGTGAIKLGTGSRWITVQAPAIDTIIADKLPSNICTNDNISKAKQILETTKTYSSEAQTWHEQKHFMFKVISVCSPASGTDMQLKWLATLTIDWTLKQGLPRDEYLKAAHSMGKYVNAALCGTSARGMLSSNSQIIELAKSMGFSSSKVDHSDGVTSIDSCVALKSLKLKFGGENVNFGSHYLDPYYLGNVAQSDIPLYADSKTDIRSQYRKWVTNLNLIQDAVL